jgi:AbrB family looped-hinge helix DNA binding protein
VAAAGWETAIALSADLSRSLRVRLSPAGGIQRPVPGTKSPHVDKDGRIVVPSGLRNFLALQPGDLLLAWTIGDGIVHLAPASVLPAVFAAFDEGIPDQSVLHGTEGDATATGATVHRVDEARARRPRPTRTPSRQGP